MQRVFLTDRSGSTVDKRNRSVLLSGSGEEYSGLWSAQVLLLFKIRVRGSVDSQQYAVCSIWW